MSDDRAAMLAMATLAALIVTLFMLAIPRKAHGGEQQLCQLEPQALGEWHYRTKVGGRPEKCFYEGPRMKPRSELYWAETPAIPGHTPAMKISPSIRPPWAEEGRFKGEGWDHKE